LEDYRTRYGNIQRLDLILEGRTTAQSLQALETARVLMLFYLFSAEELGELFERLGYPFEYETIPRNIAYYAGARPRLHALSCGVCLGPGAVPTGRARWTSSRRRCRAT